jgi:hypothetical protein
MEPGDISINPHTTDSVSALTSSLSGNTTTNSSSDTTADATITTAATTVIDDRTPNQDNDTHYTNVSTPSTSRQNRKRDAEKYTSPSANQTNIPNSPDIPHSLLRTEAELEELQEQGYDSDGYLPPFMNPDEDLDFNEDPLISIESEVHRNQSTARVDHFQQPPIAVVGPSVVAPSNVAPSVVAPLVSEQQQPQPPLPIVADVLLNHNYNTMVFLLIIQQLSVQ